MSRKLSPIVSEFETETQAAQHDQWFRSKVQASLDKPGQGVAQQVVMAAVDAVIQQAEPIASDKSR